MRRVLCFVGIHHWEHHVNPEKDGPDNGWDLCSRCGHGKPSFVFENGVPSFKGHGGRDA